MNPRSGVVEPEAPPAAADLGTPEPVAASDEPVRPPEAFPTRVTVRLRRLIPEALVRRWRPIAAWSHTRPALLAGTCALGVGAGGAAAALVIIGVFGVGTPVAPGLDYASGSVQFPGPALPASGSEIFGPLVGSAEPRPVIGEALSGYVIQPVDLPDGLVLQDSGATGLDPSSGLLGSYHAVYEPASIAAAAAQPGALTQAGSSALVVFSEVEAYEDVDSATNALNDSDVQQLGTEAGLPQLSSDATVAPTVGDESRALYLRGNTGITDVAVYVILFRDGPIVGVLGVAWPRGQESLSTAVSLAQAQSVRITAQKNAVPTVVPGPDSFP